MITPLKVGEGQPQEARPLPLGLHVLHAYMCLMNGSSRVSLMIRNISDSHIFLKKGVLVVLVMSASPVPPPELSPEMEATPGMEAKPEPMLVMVRQEKLLEKLNLDGLAHWSLRNAAVARVSLSHHCHIPFFSSAILHTLPLHIHQFLYHYPVKKKPTSENMYY